MLLVAGGIALAGVVLYPYSRAAETSRNVAAARLWIQTESPRMQKDDRFGRVQLTALTADGGTILCSGMVENVQELEQLRRIVLNGNPPVRIRWEVGTRVTPTTGPGNSM